MAISISPWSALQRSTVAPMRHRVALRRPPARAGPSISRPSAESPGPGRTARTARGTRRTRRRVAADAQLPAPAAVVDPAAAARRSRRPRAAAAAGAGQQASTTASTMRSTPTYPVISTAARLPALARSDRLPGRAQLGGRSGPHRLVVVVRVPLACSTSISSASSRRLGEDADAARRSPTGNRRARRRMHLVAVGRSIRTTRPRPARPSSGMWLGRMPISPSVVRANTKVA